MGTYHGDGAFAVEVEGETFAFSGASLGGSSEESSRSLKLTLGSGPADVQEQRLQADVAFHGEEVCVWVNGEHSDIPIVLQSPQGSDSATDSSGGGGGSIVAPMPGKIVRVLVSERGHSSRRPAAGCDGSDENGAHPSRFRCR